MYTSVQNGTRAGWRRVAQERAPWTCSCGRENPRYAKCCLECRADAE